MLDIEIDIDILVKLCYRLTHTVMASFALEAPIEGLEMHVLLRSRLALYTGTCEYINYELDSDAEKHR